MNRILTVLASAILIVVGGFFLMQGLFLLNWIQGLAGGCLLGAGVALMRSEFPLSKQPIPSSQREFPLSKQPIPSPLSPSAVQFMNRFRLWYIVANAILAVPIMLALAWVWSRPNREYQGDFFGDFLKILIIAALILNSVSYRKQAAFVRSLLTAPPQTATFQVVSFSIQFYGYNLRSALVTSLVLFIPLTFLIFYFAPLPIIFWFVPYHLITGLLIGADLRRWLQNELHKR
jgi:hypothetical protein